MDVKAGFSIAIFHITFCWYFFLLFSYFTMHQLIPWDPGNVYKKHIFHLNIDLYLKYTLNFFQAIVSPTGLMSLQG
jgi:hypothetical protein